jgi:hypothetical protein
MWSDHLLLQFHLNVHFQRDVSKSSLPLPEYEMQDDKITPLPKRDRLLRVFQVVILK